MTRLYISKWMSGDEALLFLSTAEPDITKRIVALQTAVRDNAVRGRQAGAAAAKDRSWLESGSLTSDSGLTSVDTKWRSRFIICDFATIVPAEFASESEFMREDIMRAFAVDALETANILHRPLTTSATTHPRAGSMEVQMHCRSYVEREMREGRNPTQTGYEHEFRKEGLNWSRDQWRNTFKREVARAGGAIGRGRPRKARK